MLQKGGIQSSSLGELSHQIAHNNIDMYGLKEPMLKKLVQNPHGE